MGKIYLIDVTNRDGVQTAKLGLSKLAKTMINVYLNQMGVFQSEFGFPTTRHESNYLKANLRLQEMGALEPIRLGGWLRATADDVDRAFELVPGLRDLNLSISTSSQMIHGKFRGMNSEQAVLDAAMRAVDTARKRGARSVGLNAEDASRTAPDFLVRFGLAGKEHGADRLRYCDTLGYDTPFTIYEACKLLAQEVKMPIELHCHNDLGMAVANSVAGAMGVLDGGQDAYINTTVNGIGERAGNADLVAIVLALKKAKGLERKHHFGMPIHLNAAWKICNYASYAFKVPIAINQPGVGANAFAHASGIHADGVLKDPHNYELYDFKELGRGDPEIVETGREICSGEYSGISGFRHLMGKLEVDLTSRADAENILELVRFANVEAQKPLVEEELLFIARYPEIARDLLTLTPLS
ncbi:MAG: homocitrate synthase [Chloroflexi bacterium RBG_16_57_8]|nr:MAG: homocitrate synthase [Chloroflexi bacterium RBG_16_57_8]